jgi:signal transduction histidine kinase
MDRHDEKESMFSWFGLTWPSVPALVVWLAGGGNVRRRRAEDELREAQRRVEASRDELRRLVEERAALRRVAKLVAGGAAPADVFAAVTQEALSVLGADGTLMFRLDPEGEATVVAVVGRDPGAIMGSCWKLNGAVTAVLRSGRLARCNSWSDACSPVADVLRQMGARSAVAAAIAVEGRLWGGLAIASRNCSLPADAEQRLTDFTDLIDTAILITESRAQLIASRARVVAAADETRRRIERDLHDGTQQRLVALALALRSAEAEVPSELAKLKDALSQTVLGLVHATEELQEIARGIHPAILTNGGIGPALKALARHAGVPAELDLSGARRLPERVAVALYYVVSEALSNAAKHARASAVHVELKCQDAVVEVSIRDDGVGGADPDRGSGLIGLRDRVEALGGTIETTSIPGQGTSLLARIPLCAGREVG